MAKKSFIKKDSPAAVKAMLRAKGGDKKPAKRPMAERAKSRYASNAG